MNTEKTIKWLKKRPVILLSSVLLVVISSIITLIEDGSKLYGFYKVTIGHNAELDKKLNSLSVEVDIGYFNSVLGAPAIFNSRTIAYEYSTIRPTLDLTNPEVAKGKSISDLVSFELIKGEAKYKEYFYIAKDYYVQAVTDEEGKVGLYSITARRSNYIPEIETDTGTIVRLGRSVYAQLERKPDKVAGLLSMNMRHFNYYEIFRIDPGNYRYEVFSTNPNGALENVGGLNWGVRSVISKVFSGDDDFPMDKQHEQFRKETTINSYSVTAPWFNGIDMTGDGVNYGGAKINFGPHIDQVSMIK